MATDTSRICAVCGALDFKRCTCPWDKAFEHWTGMHKSRLRALLSPGPRPNS